MVGAAAGNAAAAPLCLPAGEWYTNRQGRLGRIVPPAPGRGRVNARSVALDAGFAIE